MRSGIVIDTIEVTINNKKYKYSKHITLQEIYIEHQEHNKYPILIARVNNRLRELSHDLTEDCTVEFLDLTSCEGHRVHVGGLTFVLIYAVKKLYGKAANVIVQHSLDKGIYFQTTFKLTEEKLLAIKEEMRAIIRKDMPITRLTIDRLEAIKYFKEVGDEAKAGAMKYNTDNYITLYRLGNIYNYFYKCFFIMILIYFYSN